jgi:general secretion pathway protein N
MTFSWLTLGAGAYLAFVVALFPAPVAYRWLAPEEVRLAGIEGTLWSGRAALGSVGDFGLHEIEWQLRPWSLLLARASGEFQTRFADGVLSTRVSARLTTVSLRDLRASLRLSALRELLPLGGVRGFASADLAELELEQGWPTSAVGQLLVGELAVPSIVPSGTGALIPMGNYRVTFADASGSGLAGSFEDQGGPLEVAGSLRLNRDREYLIEGVVRARPEAPPELAQALVMMTGEPDASGMRTFSLPGSL